MLPANNITMLTSKLTLAKHNGKQLTNTTTNCIAICLPHPLQQEQTPYPIFRHIPFSEQHSLAPFSGRKRQTRSRKTVHRLKSTALIAIAIVAILGAGVATSEISSLARRGESTGRRRPHLRWKWRRRWKQTTSPNGMNSRAASRPWTAWRFVRACPAPSRGAFQGRYHGQQGRSAVHHRPASLCGRGGPCRGHLNAAQGARRPHAERE